MDSQSEDVIKIIEAAAIFKSSLTDYRKRINEEAGKLALRSPSLLQNRAELQRLSQEKVHEGGYAYKKGKSRSKRFGPPESTPKRPKKMNAGMRHEWMTELEEDIKQINQQLIIKEKRRNQSEAVQNYKLCDEIMDEISHLKSTLREKTRERKALERKVYQANWYRKRSESSDRESETSMSTTEIVGGESEDASSSSELSTPKMSSSSSQQTSDGRFRSASPLFIPQTSASTREDVDLTQPLSTQSDQNLC